MVWWYTKVMQAGTFRIDSSGVIEMDFRETSRSRNASSLHRRKEYFEGHGDLISR